MMLLYYIILAVVAAAGVFAARNKLWVSVSMVGFFVIQLLMTLAATLFFYQQSFWFFFRLDSTALTYISLMSVVGLLSSWRSVSYLYSESLRHYKIYALSLMVLAVSLVGVYSASNVAVNWIFLEATTLATAGLTYHRRTARALEATWKYIFLSSVGIAIAYLGVLLLATASHDSLDYDVLRSAVALPHANPLYLRFAFLLLLVGYSTKLEIFPLFTVGIDANHSAPSPASAFISSALVGGGFVSLLRIYQVAIGSSVADWFGNVLMLVGVLSLIVAGVYMGRTSNIKRLLAYSTVEHSSISLIGLALGGVGVFAAVLHSVGHTLIKGMLFLQLSVVGRLYDSYKIGRIGGYFAVDRLGALVLILGIVGLIAAPTSVLFVSEFMIFSLVIDSDKWWLIIVMLLPLLACTYWALSKLLSILFAASGQLPDMQRRWSIFSFVLILILLIVFVGGVWRGDLLNDLIWSIAQ